MLEIILRRHHLYEKNTRTERTVFPPYGFCIYIKKKGEKRGKREKNDRQYSKKTRNRLILQNVAEK